ncbi:MAG: potassium-transporting ATPase subunit KdpC [Sporomusaceae bacterium]|nr:potassium-transporting ATPase subunit KdpC [Sporomusaceae bacterium]
MVKQFANALLLLIVLTLITGVGYPLLITGVAQALFPTQANGSFLAKEGKLIGSSLIGQNFTKPEYFHGRPSAAGDDGYDAANSSASNLGPTSEKLIKGIAVKAADFRTENHLADDVKIPADAVMASASGLDPDISIENAYLQAARIAAARGISEDTVKSIINKQIEAPHLGGFKVNKVNVLNLNVALDGVSSNYP